MARYPRRIPLLLGVALLLGPTSRAAAADWPVPRGPSREPEPYRYDATAWKQVPREFLDDAPACTLYAGLNHLVEADGTVETVTHRLGPGDCLRYRLFGPSRFACPGPEPAHYLIAIGRP